LWKCPFPCLFPLYSSRHCTSPTEGEDMRAGEGEGSEYIINPTLLFGTPE
jgi:hypothetical protein